MGGPMPSPSMVESVRVPIFSPATAAPPDDLPRARRAYAPSATTPLWWMLGTIGAYIGALSIHVTLVVSAFDSSFYENDANVSGWRIAAIVVVWLLAYGVFAMWLTLIGSNAGTYGLGLVVATTFPWWAGFAVLQEWGAIPIVVSWLIIMVWPYRLLVTGIWEAGKLPSLFALIGWMPFLAGIAMGLGPEVLARMAVVPISISVLFFWGAAIAVTIIQHLGIAEDRKRALGTSW